MSFLSKLLPSEDKFFKLMCAMARQAHDGAVLLQTFTSLPAGPERDVAGQKIAAIKAESKKLAERVTHEVAMSFITPFDREDIQEFANHLYKIPKTIDKIRERLEMHNIKSEQGDFTRQVDLIAQEAKVMLEITEALTHKGAAKAIMEKVVILHELESNGDDVLADLMSSLFKSDRDVRDLILRKDLYDMLEKVLDRYRDAAGVALQIVLKHS